jgi:hypothetical protein
MNSLAHEEQRTALFENIKAPEHAADFHDRDTLLWNVKTFLDKSVKDPNMPRGLQAYLRSQIVKRRSGYEENGQPYPGFLYPSPSTPTSANEREFFAAWDDLAYAIQVAAERLWRDQFLQDDSDDAIQRRFHEVRRDPDDKRRARQVVGAFQLVCQQSQVLMHMWLETTFFGIRAMKNVRSGELILHPSNRSLRIEGQLDNIIKEYLDKLAEWENRIKAVTKLGFFGLQYGDVQWFRALSKEFGPTSVHVEETGWIPLAADAKTELRYQFFKARRRENWKTHHRLSAIIQWLFGVTTGYGTRPMRFLYTAIVLWLASAFAFFVNDLLILQNDPSGAACPSSHPQIHQWTDLLTKLPDLLTSFVQDLYIAATTLATMGNNPTLAAYCTGLSTQVVLTLTVFSGYFMLGLLSALLYTQLTEKD